MPGGGDQGAVGERDAGQLGLGAEGAHQDPVHAVGLVAGLADLAGVVGGPEGADDEVADLDGADLVADLLDDADVLVTHHLVVDRLGAAVGPQVGPADAGRRQADDRVGRLDDPRVLAVLDPDVAGSVHDYLTHRGMLLFAGFVSTWSWTDAAPRHRVNPPAATGWKSLSMGVLTGHPRRSELPSSARPTLDDVDNRSRRCASSSPLAAPASPPTRSGSRRSAPAACPGCDAARSRPWPGSASSTTPDSSVGRSPARPPGSSTRSPGRCSSTRPSAPTSSTSPAPPTASPPRAAPGVVRRARPPRDPACSGRSRPSPTASPSSATRTRTCSPPTASAARSTPR